MDFHEATREPSSKAITRRLAFTPGRSIEVCYRYRPCLAHGTTLFTYVEEEIAGLYGHNHEKVRGFMARCDRPEYSPGGSMGRPNAALACIGLKASE